MHSKKKSQNVFYDDRGFPDESDAYNHLLHNIDGSIVQWKKKYGAPALDQDDPVFNYVYSEAKNGERLKELNLSHLQPEERERLTALIKKYWCVFDECGTFVPIRHYQYIIDTGSAAPIAIKKIHYGPGEVPIMRKSIAALVKMGQIVKSMMANGFSKPSSPPSPIKNTFTISKTLSGAFASTTFP
jgi:hypothetical protein